MDRRSLFTTVPIGPPRVNLSDLVSRKPDERRRPGPAAPQNGAMEPAQLNRAPFADLDRAPAELHPMLFAALEAMGRHPEIRRVRQVAFDALRPSPGQRLLDAGSGTGDVARQLAARVAPGGAVVGVDFSERFVEAARERETHDSITYVQGDVTHLDLGDDTVDGVWCERVLQHVTDADAAIAELARITRPGGRVCLIDTDWQSLAFDGMPDDVTAEFMVAVGERFVGFGKAMGRTLRRRAIAAGLTGVEATPVLCFFPDPAAAAVVLPMVNPDVPVAAGLIPGHLRDRWFAEVAAAGERGDFLAVLTIWVVTGTVPST
jgi:SAM-dependent methyltransferase